MKTSESLRCFASHVLVGSLLGGTAALTAAESPAVSTHIPQTLTVDAVVEEVVRKNPEIDFYRAEITAAKAGRRTAAQWNNPEVSADLGSKRVWERGGPAIGDGAAWSVSVAQTFEYPGRIALRKAIANQQVELAELGLAQFQAALAARARAKAQLALAAQQKADATHEVVVRLPGNLRERIEEIRALPVRVGEHGLVALEKVAEFRTVASVDPIVREEGRRRVALMVNLSGRDVESFVKDAEARIRDQVRFPEGYTYEFGGQFKNLQEARLRLLIVVPATLVLIFLLIFVAFGSLRQALLIYTGIPLAITGGVLALYLRGMPFSITAAVGFIALSGVAVLNGVVMISYFNELREQGLAMCQAVFDGAMTRLRPVLMTAFVASLGFVPMAIATGPGAEVQRPLATVVIGGILSSTFLTLVLLPVLYVWFERERCPTPAVAAAADAKQVTPPSTPSEP